MREYSPLRGQDSFAPPMLGGARADSAYVPNASGLGGTQSFMPSPVPVARPGMEFMSQSMSPAPSYVAPPLPSGPIGSFVPAPLPTGLVGPGVPRDGASFVPNDGGYGFDRIVGLGTWSELIAGGVVDRPYIEQEAERRKQEIDRHLDNQMAQMETHCQEQCSSIKQQAEYHTQMSEKQIEQHKRQHLAQIARQAELQSYAILQKAEMEKGRLGQEAYRALAVQSEREKAAVLHEAMRKAEDLWRHQQRALMEQAQKAKADIDVQAQRRAMDIEKDAREAVSRVYISPQGPLASGQPVLVGPATVSPLGSFGGLSAAERDVSFNAMQSPVRA